MDQRQMIQKYLNTLQGYLARLSPAEATEVIREIESHIYDLIEQHEAQGKAADAAAILQGFGEPRQLAAQYVAHLTTGAPPPRGFKAIVQVKKTVSAALYYSVAVFGFLISGCLFFLAAAKMLLVEEAGVWVGSAGNSVSIALMSNTLQQEDELLGMALIPVSIIAALAIFWCTRRVLQVLKQHM